MPRQPSVNKIRLIDITTCLTLALPLLNELHDAFEHPFLQSIANTIQTLVNSVQLMENIHKVLYAIVHLHMKSEPAGSIPRSMLDNIGEFLKTLHKIYMFIEAQQQGNKIKHLFHSNEINKLLQDCHTGLKQAQEVFCIQTQTQILSDIRDFTDTVNLMHKELMELIEKQSDASTLSERSSVYVGVSESKNSSNSFSMLPSKPKIFHGCDLELKHILKLISQCSPRIAILGGGGMGKTSLARAVLHHPDTCSKFEHRFFDLTRPVVQYFSRKIFCLLILDNLETVWEPITSRAGVEEFLSLLAGVEHLSLIITMRGAERPAKVQWTHPFLVPLQSLSNVAARQTFIEITDNSLTIEEIDKLLGFTDNMPLAVDLIAHLADYEGFSNVLARWKTEKTSLLSVGFDRQSSVNASINLSLSSPRITLGSKELLSLLSILPNGLSEAELVQSNLGIPNILTCKAALEATSLIYRDNNQRLMHFYAVLELFIKYQGEQMKPVVNQITLNLANLQEVLQRGLHTHGVSEDMIAQPMSWLDHIGDPVLASQFYYAAGYHLFHHKADIQQATRFFHKGLAISELCVDNYWHSTTLIQIGWLKYHTSDYHAGNRYAAAAQRLCEWSANFYEEAYAIQLGAQCNHFLGDYQKSAAQLQRATELLHRCGMSGGALHYSIMGVQAEIHLLKSEYTEARKVFSQIVQSTSTEQNSLAYGSAPLNTGLIDTIIGGAEDKIYCNLKAAQEIARRDVRYGIIIYDMVQVIIEFQANKFDLSQIKFQQCLQLSCGKDMQTEHFCLEQLANITAWPDKLAFHKALFFLGDAFLANNDEEPASNLYQVALEGFTRMDVHRSRAQCMLRLGDLANKHGCTSEAINLWNAARPLFEQSVPKDVLEIDSRLATTERAHQTALGKLETLHAPIQVSKKTSELEINYSVDEDTEEYMVPGIV
ncbi:hypothetical protein K438DRAFT_1749738 [Mycena galopus ATCC 62051]|nr:hypothetical protein K438DRAFT_1749738 [Mycena galopus ATCC 62051]